ncbi:MAG: hypothetical protein SWY16_02505 [Cyanobacteriota bacterium]|nr:hypothetical protein [Cyanobacteriota bacterium]
MGKEVVKRAIFHFSISGTKKRLSPDEMGDRDGAIAQPLTGDRHLFPMRLPLSHSKKHDNP